MKIILKGEVGTEIMAITRSAIREIQRIRKQAGTSENRNKRKNSRLGKECKANLIQPATRKPKDGYTSWSQWRIAKEVGMSQGKVQQMH